jgi:hypothetical protein
MARAPREYRSHRNAAVPVAGASFGSDNPPRSRSAAGSGLPRRRRRPHQKCASSTPARPAWARRSLFVRSDPARKNTNNHENAVADCAQRGATDPAPRLLRRRGLQQTKQIRRADAVALKHLATKLQPMPHVTEIQGFARASDAMAHGSGARLRFGAIPHQSSLQPARRPVTHRRNGPRTCSEDTARVPGLAIAPEGTACARQCT